MKNKERDRMPQNNPDLLAAIVAFFQSIWPSVAAGFSAFGVAFFRVIYYGGGNRKAFVEAAFIGCIGAFTVPVLLHLGMPAPLAGGAGAMAGLLGVDKLREIAARFVDRKIDK